MTVPALVLQNLHHTFFAGTPSEQRALQGVDLTMEERAFVIVLGNNGSGKSTLLNAIAGTLVPDLGTVRLAGRDVTRWSEWRRAALVGRVFQNPMSGSIPDLTVAENLAVAAKRGRHRGVLMDALGRGRRRNLAEQVGDLGLGL
jgi:putative tryptophan/tyrosine transport system ATP-binding protein